MAIDRDSKDRHISAATAFHDMDTFPVVSPGLVFGISRSGFWAYKERLALRDERNGKGRIPTALHLRGSRRSDTQTDLCVCQEFSDGMVAFTRSLAGIAHGCASRKYGHYLRCGVADVFIGFGVCM